MRGGRPTGCCLAESDRRRGAVLEAVDEGVVVLDLDGRVLQANAAASTILAVDVLSDGAGAGWWETLTALHAAPGAAVPTGAGVLRTGRAARRVIVQIDRADGAPASLSVNYLPWRDADGVVGGLVLAFRDLAERREAGADRAVLLDEIDVSVVATDADGHVTEWNRGAEELYGWSRVEAMGRPVSALITASAPASSAGLGDAPRRVRQGETEAVARHRFGARFPVLTRERPLLDARGRIAGTIGVSMDLSDRVAADRELLEARNYVHAVADAMGEGLFTLATDGTLVYMNHAAETLLGWSRDELLGRVMHHVIHPRRADGTAMAISETPIAQASRDGVKVRVEDGAFRTRDGADLAVAYTAAPFETGDGVQGCAVVFSDVSERRAREVALRQDVDKLAWIRRIQEGLAEDRFVLHAQPIIDMATGDVVQRELLLRLVGVDGNLIAPGEFLGVAEQFGLICDIDRWVIGEAIAVAAQGHAVELNLSARSVCDAGTLEHIERCLCETGADPALLVFEITETAIVEDQSCARAFAERLRALGSRLALDDFGTGYGGFMYLKQIPVDFLKIDVEFVRDLATNPASRHVVDAVVSLAQGFGVQTVAEGVEDAATMVLLRELGVDRVQGFHLGRPAPFDAATTTRDGSSPEARAAVQPR